MTNELLDELPESSGLPATCRGFLAWLEGQPEAERPSTVDAAGVAYVRWMLAQEDGELHEKAAKSLQFLAEIGAEDFLARLDLLPLAPPERELEASCPRCGLAVWVTRRWANVALPVCPTHGERLVLTGKTSENDPDWYPDEGGDRLPQPRRA